MILDRQARSAATAQVTLAVLAVIGALHWLRPILMPIAVAMVLACILSPVATFFRRRFPFGPLGAVMLLLLLALGGLYFASLTAESLVNATNTLPSEIERLAGRVSSRIAELVRDHPYLRGVLPEPGTIDRLGDTHRALLIDQLSYGLADFTTWAFQGFIVLVLIIFMLAESDLLTAKLIRFFAPTPGKANSAAQILDQVTRKIRAYLIARTVINLGLGLVVAAGLWALRVHYPLALGLFAGVTNFVPYIGQLLGGGLPALIALGQTGSLGDALLVISMYLAVAGIEGYIVTPFVMGRSLDLNGTTVLVVCLFWGFLWGLVGLVLAMPITVSMKLVFQTIPELNRWAELMSVDWQSPPPEAEGAELLEPVEVVVSADPPSRMRPTGSGAIET
ncbi:MAG: permease [Planctomycetes bacterium SCN 63-9]|nr:MAG: permease [Planctomycetes bacterium SCN 63-9]